jgi:inhibitor of KinA
VNPPNSPIEIVSHCALRVRFADRIRADLPALIQSVCQQLETLLGDHLTDLIPAYTSLLVIFNPQSVELTEAQKILRQALTRASEQQNPNPPTNHQIPVYYGEETGWDLAWLSEQKALSIAQIIELHSQPTYQVYTIGFSPAFAYLAEIPERLAAPRRATPRLHIPAGGVGIADRQTAVYPLDSPGGWRILGRTPLDLSLKNPRNLIRFKIGDQIHFEPISRQIFQRLQK